MAKRKYNEMLRTFHKMSHFTKILNISKIFNKLYTKSTFQKISQEETKTFQKYKHIKIFKNVTNIL